MRHEHGIIFKGWVVCWFSKTACVFTSLQYLNLSWQSLQTSSPCLFSLSVLEFDLHERAHEEQRFLFALKRFLSTLNKILIKYMPNSGAILVK